MPRILGIQIANGFSPEARVFATLVRHAPHSSIQADVLHQADASDSADAADQFAQASGANITRIDFGWRPAVAERSQLATKAAATMRFVLSMPGVLARVRKIKPDAVYSSQQAWDCRAATWIARSLGLPQVIHLHYVIGPWLKTSVLRRLVECDHVITVSDFIRQEALRHGVAPERVTSVQNPLALSEMVLSDEQRKDARISVRKELGVDPGVSLIGIVARLDPTKGQSDTIQAFAQIAASHRNALLLVIGSASPWYPEYQAELQALAERAGCAAQTRFLGRRQDIPRLLAAMDIFIHPSRHEPFGLAMAEASAAEIPVVAYAEGGANEIVVPGKTGLLADPGDIAGLSSCLRTLLTDPRQARALGIAGRARIAANFRPQDAGKAFANCIDGVLPKSKIKGYDRSFASAASAREHTI